MQNNHDTLGYREYPEWIFSVNSHIPHLTFEFSAAHGELKWALAFFLRKTDTNPPPRRTQRWPLGIREAKSHDARAGADAAKVTSVADTGAAAGGGVGPICSVTFAQA
eukprot:6183598-Pleurochrysis_carterae.AAC.3